MTEGVPPQKECLLGLGEFGHGADAGVRDKVPDNELKSVEDEAVQEKTPLQGGLGDDDADEDALGRQREDREHEECADFGELSK